MSPEPAAVSIFISYRRGGTEGITGRIRDRLVTRFGEDAVFIDVDSIPDGVNFRQHLAKHIKRCDVMVAVIGDDWLRKIRTKEDDFVRIELELAQAYGLQVLPVRVGRGLVPQKRQLPSTLRWLPEISAPFVDSGRDFEAHARRLIKSIEGLLAIGRPDTDEVRVEPPPPPATKEPAPPPGAIQEQLSGSKPVWRYAIGGVAIGGAILAGLGVAGVSFKTWSPAPGRLKLSVVPAAADAWLDGQRVDIRSPGVIEKAAGTHVLAVARDGYVRNEQKVELRSGEPLDVNVTLEPSADTGFELTSDPPGGLVWLDGALMSGPSGQARTDFRAYQIPPGHHTLEIKGDREFRFRPWKEDIEVELGAIRKVHATLDPLVMPEPAPKPEPNDQPKQKTSPSQAAVMKVISDNKFLMNVCSERALEKNEIRAGGKVVVRLTIDMRGRMKSMKVDGPSNLRVLNTCIRYILSTWHFPTFTEDYGTEFSYVFRLTDGNGPGTAPGTTASTCVMTIGSQPWAELWIDGKNTNKHTPFFDYTVACGKHKLTFKRADLRIDHTETITISPGDKFKQSWNLMSDSD